MAFKPGSKSWKNFMQKLYGIGAAVVIVGALFKIMHWKGADIMLIVGLSTEAVIFIFSSFEPLPHEYDWGLVYPELEPDSDSDNEIDRAVTRKAGLNDLDNMLDDAKITPELLDNLGNGLRSLGDQATKLSDITNASVATNDYVDSLKSASVNVSQLSETYSKASESLTGLQNTESAGRSAGESLQRLTENLNKLNEAYELQINGASESLKSSNQAFESINTLLTSLNESAQDTVKYKEGMSELSTNISTLNSVYGNMLAAMNMRAGNNG